MCDLFCFCCSAAKREKDLLTLQNFLKETEKGAQGNLLSFLLLFFFSFFFGSSSTRTSYFPLSLSLLFLFARLPDAEKEPFKNHGTRKVMKTLWAYFVHGDLNSNAKNNSARLITMNCSGKLFKWKGKSFDWWKCLLVGCGGV